MGVCMRCNRNYFGGDDMGTSTVKWKPPCKDCEDRHTACHSHCERFKEYKYNLEEKKRKERNEKHYQDLHFIDKKRTARHRRGKRY